nr:DUF4194 domain-containing protein [Myceligenerans sp. TRM 65318]
MEEDPHELFPGDSGGIPDPEVRRVLVRLLQRRFLVADRNPAQWRVLLENQQTLESRLHDLFVQLVVDHDRGIAYKNQVRSAELDVPILLKDDAYNRAETLVLVHLRTIFQRERGAGETSARVDIEEIEQTVLTYYDVDDSSLATRQNEIRGAVRRLAKEGVIQLESEGRYRVTPLVEIVLSNERLVELRTWLAEQNGTAPAADVDRAPADAGHAVDAATAVVDDAGHALADADANVGSDVEHDAQPEPEEAAR